ncbi:hypothetical protein F5X99DRAFT_389319 [Biscogniauxia marginata]|nr:hypothetical protein F5X99DRAFT_389319 [Biscogniauxia marginata]
MSTSWTVGGLLIFVSLHVHALCSRLTPTWEVLLLRSLTSIILVLGTEGYVRLVHRSNNSFLQHARVSKDKLFHWRQDQQHATSHSCLG